MAKKLDNKELENVSGGGCSKTVTVKFKVTFLAPFVGFPTIETVDITFDKGKSDEDAVKEWCKKYNYTLFDYERV